MRTFAARCVIGSVLVPLVPAWPFGLIEHFRFQYLWVGVLVVAGWLAYRFRSLLLTVVATLVLVLSFDVLFV